jgi:hypothetical protein
MLGGQHWLVQLTWVLSTQVPAATHKAAPSPHTAVHTSCSSPGACSKRHRRHRVCEPHMQKAACLNTPVTELLCCRSACMCEPQCTHTLGWVWAVQGKLCGEGCTCSKQQRHRHKVGEQRARRCERVQQASSAMQRGASCPCIAQPGSCICMGDAAVQSPGTEKPRPDWATCT